MAHASQAAKALAVCLAYRQSPSAQLVPGRLILAACLAAWMAHWEAVTTQLDWQGQLGKYWGMGEICQCDTEKCSR